MSYYRHLIHLSRGARRHCFWVLIGLITSLVNAQGPFEPRLRAAQELRHSGNTDAALGAYKTLLASLNQRKGFATMQARAFREVGEILLERKDFLQAAINLEKSLARDPSQGAVHYELGLAYRNLGDHRRAAAQFADAINQGFRNFGVRFNLAAAYFSSRQSAAGLEQADQIMLSASKSPDTLFRLGRLLFDHLYYREAVKAFRGVYDAQPESFEPRFYLALTYYLLKQYSEAAGLLSSWQVASSNAEVGNLLAASLAASGELDKASALLQRIILRVPWSPHAYLNLALIRLEQGRVEDAEMLLQSFRALGPQSDAKVFYQIERNQCAELAGGTGQPANPVPEKAALYFDLASQMQKRFNHASAVALLLLAKRYEGTSDRLLYAGGMSCLNLPQHSQDAISLLRKAVERDPRRDEAWHLLGRAYLQQGNVEEAVNAFRTALARKPRASYAVSLGKAMLSKQRTAEEDTRQQARQAFEQALDLEPSNPVALYELGRLLSQQEKLREARDLLTRAVKLEPDFYEAYYLLGRVYSRLGDRNQSQKYLALFEHTKRAAREHSVASSGYINDVIEP